MFVENVQACGWPTLVSPTLCLILMYLIFFVLQVVSRRTCFKPDLLGGQEVTCLGKTPLETNGEEPMCHKVYYGEGVLLRFI